MYIRIIEKVHWYLFLPRYIFTGKNTFSLLVFSPGQGSQVFALIWSPLDNLPSGMTLFGVERGWIGIGALNGMRE